MTHFENWLFEANKNNRAGVMHGWLRRDFSMTAKQADEEIDILQKCKTEGDYIRASRVGKTITLDRTKRKSVWAAWENASNHASFGSSRLNEARATPTAKSILGDFNKATQKHKSKQNEPYSMGYLQAAYHAITKIEDESKRGVPVEKIATTLITEIEKVKAATVSNPSHRPDGDQLKNEYGINAGYADALRILKKAKGT